MKSKLLLTIIGLVLFLGTSIPGFASSIALQWDSNTETDLAGYKLYYKADSPELPFEDIGTLEAVSPSNDQILTTATVSGLDPGRTYYFALTAYNTAGLESSYSKTVTVVVPLPDTTPPDVSTFTIPATYSSLTVPITTFSASDNVGVSGYLLTSSAVMIPSANDPGWSATAQTSYAFASQGSNSLYAWAKDAAGNISNAIGKTVNISLPDTIAPVVSSFTIPATSSSLTVPVTVLAATDNRGVSGYLITESATTPTAGVTGWSASAPTSFAFSGEGSKTIYAWAKDAAGNISSSLSSSTTITIPQSGYTISDALQALRVSVGLIKPTSDRIKRLDVAPLLNGKVTPDGKINISDALMLLSKSVGLVSW